MREMVGNTGCIGDQVPLMRCVLVFWDQMPLMRCVLVFWDHILSL